jgi:hypothetical protein
MGPNVDEGFVYLNPKMRGLSSPLPESLKTGPLTRCGNNEGQKVAADNICVES